MTVSKPVKKALVLRNSVAPKPVVVSSERKEKKEKKLKVVRDSFTMPQVDYDLITELKQRALKVDLHVKKSELLRVGLQVLAKQTAAQFKQSVASLEKIKTGRPKKD
ncbi:MAG: hypothetical protein WCI39_00400 [Gallionellaceae bacterium]